MKLRETVIVSGGLLAQQITVFATGVLIARQLGADAYGALGVLKSFSGVVVILTSLGLDLSLLKHASLYKDRAAELHTLSRALRVVAVLCNVALLFAVVVGLGDWLSRTYAIAGFAYLCAITMFGIVFAADIQISGALYRVFDRVVPYALIVNYGQPVLRLVLSVGVLLAGGGVVEIVWVNTIVLVASYAVLALDGRAMMPPVAAMPAGRLIAKARSILSESLWMAMSLLVYQMIRLVDVLVLAAIVGAKSAGEYAAMSSVAQLIQIYPNAISQTLGPKIALAYSAGNKLLIHQELRDYLRKTSLLGGFLFGGIAIFGCDLDLVFGASFKFPGSLAFLLAFGWYLSALLAPFGYVLSMTGRHREELFILSAGGVVLIALLLLWVPPWHAVGAAMAVATTFAIVNGVRCGYVLRLVGSNPLAGTDMLIPSTFLAIAAACRQTGILLVERSLIAVCVECVAYAALAALLYFATMANLEERNVAANLAKRGLRLK